MSRWSLEDEIEEIERDYIKACRNDVMHVETVRENLRSRENLKSRLDKPKKVHEPAVVSPVTNERARPPLPSKPTP